MQFYPTVQYSLPKIFVKFLDKHEFIYIAEVLPGKPHCYMYDDLEEIPLKPKELELVEKFFNYMWEFKFIH